MRVRLESGDCRVEAPVGVVCPRGGSPRVAASREEVIRGRSKRTADLGVRPTEALTGDGDAERQRAEVVNE